MYLGFAGYVVTEPGRLRSTIDLAPYIYLCVKVPASFPITHVLERLSLMAKRISMEQSDLFCLVSPI